MSSRSSKEKFNVDKHTSNSQKHEASRSVSSSHARRKSPHSGNRNSSQERHLSGDVNERPNFSENWRVAYRTDDNSYERPKSDKDKSYHSSSYNHRDYHPKVIERNHDLYKEKTNLSSKNLRLVEDVHNDKQIDLKLSQDDRYSGRRSFDRSRSRSPKNDYVHYKHLDTRSTHITDNRRDKSYNNKSSEFSERSTALKVNNFDNSEEGQRYRDNRHETYRYSDREDRYRSNSSFRGKGSYNATDERHISFKNSSASGDDEFVASLLQKIDFLSNQVEHLTQENENLKHSLKEESSAEISIKFGNKRFEEKFLPILKDVATDLMTGRCSADALASFLGTTDTSQLQSESWNLEGELFSLDNSCDEPKESTSVPRYDHSFKEVLQSSEFLQGNEAVNKRESKAISKVCFNCDGDHFLNECTLPQNRRKIAIARRKKQSTFVPNKRYHVYENENSKFKPGVISEELRQALDLEQDQVPDYIYRMRILDYPPGWQAEAAIESSGIALYDNEGIAQLEEKSKKESSECSVQYDSDKLIDFPGFNIPLTPNFIDQSEALGFPAFQVAHMHTHVKETIQKPELPSRKRKIDLPKPKSSKVTRLDESMDVDEDLDPTIIELKEFQPPLPEDVLPPPPPPDCPIVSSEYSPFSPTSSPTTLSYVPSSPSYALTSPSRTPNPSSYSPASPDYKPDSPEGENEECRIQKGSQFKNVAHSPILNPDSTDYISMMEPLLMESLSPSSGDVSPSLRELEEMKKQLVMELSIATEPSSPAVPINAMDDDTESLKTVASDQYGPLEIPNESSNLSDSSFSSKASNNGVSVTLPRTDSIGSKLVTLGTPSISRHSSFKKLPKYENFSKDVTSHMNFENLPNSTGTYQRMKKVIKKVKDKLNSMMH